MASPAGILLVIREAFPFAVFTKMNLKNECSQFPEGDEPLKPVRRPPKMMTDTENWRSRRFRNFCFCLLILSFFFLRPLLSLVALATGSQLHSHILLIPFIFAYLIYLRRDRLTLESPVSIGWGIPCFLIGSAALALAFAFPRFSWTVSPSDHLALNVLGFVCFVAAGGCLVLGSAWMRSLVFPFVFLVFLVPLPNEMVFWLETASKLASADAASFFFNITGTPVLRDGSIFQLPGIVIEVAQECSGIRSSLVLFITSLLVAHLFLKTAWRRIVLVAFVIPLGILRNGFRILVIGLLCVHVGPEMINSIIHRKGGPLFFSLSLIPLFLLLCWLRRGEAESREGLATDPRQLR